jgi:hypothetical protein
MARGQGSKGTRESRGGGGGPDWLKPPTVGAGAGAMRESEEPRRRRRDTDEDDERPSKGYNCTALMFLFLLVVVPGIAAVLPFIEHLQRLGWLTLPSLSSNPYRPCLQEFYADWAPDKLGGIDDTLVKYEGREKRLFAILGKKYGKPANFAKCVPKK